VNKSVYGVYGTGGCGRGVISIAKFQLESLGFDLDRLVFIDDFNFNQKVNGLKVVSFEQFLKIEASEKYIAIAISDSKARKKLHQNLINNDIKLWSLKASNTLIMDNNQIGEGSILSPFVSITSNISIGVCFHGNLYSYVEHDCIIGDYVTFAPGVKCNGNIIIGNHAYIGSGAVIKNGTKEKPLVIAENAIIGMGAVVIDDVPSGATVVGNPAKILKAKL